MTNAVNLQNNRTLIDLKKKLKEQESIEEKAYRNIEVGATYKTNRHGITKTVYVDSVKRDKVTLKRDKDAVDSFTETRERFDRFYVKA